MTGKSPCCTRRVVRGYGWRRRRLNAARRDWCVGAVLAIALAVVLRIAWLGTPPLTNDEAFSWRISSGAPSELLPRVARDVHPPGHFGLLAIWISVFGDRAAALRSLSVIFGVFTVPMTAAMAAEALRTVGGAVGSRAAVGGLVAGLLVAIGDLQVDGARTARMYSQGAFFAAFSAWSLLRAMRRPVQDRRVWVAYGMAVTCFLYSHYFSLFTVLGQATWISAVVCLGTGISRMRRTEVVRGALLAALLAATSFSPWLPVFLRQAAEVREGYWISATTYHELARALFEWGTGMLYAGDRVACLWMAAVVVAAVWCVRQCGVAAWYFLVQAAVPWCCCLAVSTVGGRPILQERYLVFAQIAWFGFCGALVASFPRPSLRTVAAAVLIGMASIGTFRNAGHWPTKTPASDLAMQCLGKEYQAGDLVLVSGAAEVNRVRHGMHLAGREGPDVRCRMGVAAVGAHQVHVASLDADDVLSPTGDAAAGRRRVWLAYRAERPLNETLKGLEPSFVRQFEGARGTRYSLALFTRPD